MKPIVWLAGIFLLLTFVFPNGLSLPVAPPQPQPVVPDDQPVAPAAATIKTLLTNAPPEDKARVVGIYRGLIDVLTRDNGTLVKTTEQWAALQERTLALAVDGTKLKGKYPGLDVAIEAVFESKLGKEKNVVPADAATRAKILAACDIIVASAR